MTAGWWDRFPGRLEFELAELDTLGIRHRLDTETLRDRGIVRVELWPVIDEVERPLVAVYPDLYPYFRFEVEAQGESLGRHQHPFGRNLCLLDRPAAAWHPDDTLGRVVSEQLPKVFRAQGHDRDPALETEQAEPLSANYTYADDSGLLVDSAWTLPDRGDFLARISFAHSAGVVRGVVTTVLDLDGNVVAEADPDLATACTQWPEVRGRWCRTDGIMTADADQVRRVLGKADRRLREEEPANVGNSTWLDVVAGVFSEEAPVAEGTADTWLFVVRTSTGSRQQRRSGATTRTRLVQALRAGRGDLAVRVPELALLGGKKIVVFGGGGIGAPSSIEFAKAGVGETVIVDGDFIDAGPAPRYPLGFSVAGMRKAFGLAAFIGAQWPYSKVTPAAGRVGGVRTPSGGEGSQADQLADLVEGADLIYDACGDPGLSVFLADLARELSVAHVVVSTTPGAWGGRVARFLPDRGPCYCCLQHAIHSEGDDVDPEDSLVPPSDPGGDIQPLGCGDVTFTGSGFDVGQVALAGVRLAVSTLCDGQTGAYPPSDWNVAIITLREPDGTPTPGSVRVVRLPVHPACERPHGDEDSSGETGRGLIAS